MGIDKVTKHGIDTRGFAYTRQANAEKGAAAGSLGAGNFPLATPPTPPASATKEPVGADDHRMLSSLRAMAQEDQVEDSAGDLHITSTKAHLIVFHSPEEVISEVRHGDGTWDEQTVTIPEGRWIYTEDRRGVGSVQADVDGAWDRISAELATEVDAYYA